jgi:hypothetical protein
MRSAVTAMPEGSAVPAWIRETASTIQTGAALRNRDQAGVWIAASASQVRGDLRRARVEHWYQQGKALCHALILCRYRVEHLDIDAPPTDHARHVPDPTAPPERSLRLLQEQVQTLGVESAAWQARRRPIERLCSLNDLQAFLADPAHAADKEPLEGIIARAQTVGLPDGLPCIRLRWDTVSGDIEHAT